MPADSKVILVDVDDTILDLLSPWLEWYNEKYDDSVTRDHIVDWDLTKFVKPECGREIYDFLHLEDCYDRCRPLEKALLGVNGLRMLGYRIVFLTAANYHQMGNKLLWLEKHKFLTLDYGTTSRDYIIAHDKSLVHGFGLVDDGAHNLINSPVPHRVMFSSQHNAGEHTFPHFRADNWDEVYSYFKNLS